MATLKTKIGGLRMDTPLIAVSGIFGIEYQNLSPRLRGVGAVVTKSVTLHPRSGNPEPRVIETEAGLLNSIGIPNPGIEKFISTKIPELRVLEVPIIGSIAGSTIEEYVKCSSLLALRDEIDAIELNVSCPNVQTGGMEFGCDSGILERLVTRVRKVTKDKTLIVKLSPNVTDIALPAMAAINGGADVISLINTLRGMAIDLNTWKPKLGNRVGGVSGVVIHPVAVYMVYRCYTSCCKKRNVPIIGMGGVSSGEDALELILAGASSIGIGTAVFRDQHFGKNKEKSIFQKVGEFLLNYLESMNLDDTSKLVGRAADT